MERYRIRIYPAAVRDLEEIVGELNSRSPSSALRCYDLLTEQVKSLALLPELCPRPKDLALRARGYRYLSVDDYLLLYCVCGDEVQLRRLMHMRSEYSGLL